MAESTEGRKAKRIELSSVEAKDRFGELLGRAGFGNERILITRHGRPVAAVIGMRDLESLEGTPLADVA
jgi:prevent-host-death family protein